MLRKIIALVALKLGQTSDLCLIFFDLLVSKNLSLDHLRLIGVLFWQSLR